MISEAFEGASEHPRPRLAPQRLRPVLCRRGLLSRPRQLSSYRLAPRPCSPDNREGDYPFGAKSRHHPLPPQVRPVRNRPPSCWPIFQGLRLTLTPAPGRPSPPKGSLPHHDRRNRKLRRRARHAPAASLRPRYARQPPRPPRRAALAGPVRRGIAFAAQTWGLTAQYMIGAAALVRARPPCMSSSLGRAVAGDPESRSWSSCRSATSLWRTLNTIPPVDSSGFVPGLLLYLASLQGFFVLLLGVLRQHPASPVDSRAAPVERTTPGRPSTSSCRRTTRTRTCFGSP